MSGNFTLSAEWSPHELILYISTQQFSKISYHQRYHIFTPPPRQTSTAGGGVMFYTYPSDQLLANL